MKEDSWIFESTFSYFPGKINSQVNMGVMPKCAKKGIKGKHQCP